MSRTLTNRKPHTIVTGTMFFASLLMVADLSDAADRRSRRSRGNSNSASSNSNRSTSTNVQINRSRTSNNNRATSNRSNLQGLLNRSQNSTNSSRRSTPALNFGQRSNSNAANLSNLAQRSRRSRGNSSSNSSSSSQNNRRRSTSGNSRRSTTNNSSGNSSSRRSNFFRGNQNSTQNNSNNRRFTPGGNLGNRSNSNRIIQSPNNRTPNTNRRTPGSGSNRAPVFNNLGPGQRNNTPGTNNRIRGGTFNRSPNTNNLIPGLRNRTPGSNNRTPGNNILPGNRLNNNNRNNGNNLRNILPNNRTNNLPGNRNNIGNGLRNNIRNGVGNNLRNGVGNNLRNGAGNNLRNGIGNNLRNGVGNNLRNRAGIGQPRNAVRINKNGLLNGIRNNNRGGNLGRNLAGNLNGLNNRGLRIGGSNFNTRFNAGQLARLTNSNIGRRLGLQNQFNLRGRGDLARRLNTVRRINNLGGWRNRPFNGLVSNNFRNNHFSVWYPGPAWGPSYAWTPRWSPWVDWCWWDYCDPYFDPRPVFCRPVIYDPISSWGYWDVPVWNPLPVVVSGTWVDVPPATVDTGIDLQLLAVRFVDPGHTEQQLGPRYRVWFRNNGNTDLATPFNVIVLAGNDADLVAELPNAGVRVEAIEAGAIQPVDIRLPFDVNQMNRDDQGRKVPFSHLHVLVDSEQELNDVFAENNGVSLARGDVLPVDPAAFAPENDIAAADGLLTVAGEGFGPEPGQVIVYVGDLEMQAVVEGWYDLGVQFTLPQIPLTGDADAEVIIVRGDGVASNPVQFVMAPANTVVQAPFVDAPAP